MPRQLTEATHAAHPTPPVPGELDRAPDRGRRARLLPMLGPAFVAAVAYVDPGNFATNVTAGSQYGYLLVWVVVASNLVAMLIQYLSAKLGIATGTSLAGLCRDHYRKPVVAGLWFQAEVVAIATDLAEVVGGAIALQLIFGLPLPVGGLVTGVVAFALLGLRRRGHRPFERLVVGLLAVILVGFVVDVAMAGIDAGALVAGTVPAFEGTDSLLLAVGMIGATVMPHAIYLHGGLTSSRAQVGQVPREVMRAQRWDVLLAMVVAGVMNLLLLVLAASALQGKGIETIEQAHAELGNVLGAGAAWLFAIGLLASGLASSSVGTLSGQMVLEGFWRRRVPDVLRRLVTLVPAVAVLAAGVDPTLALVLSQVVLSFGIPFALVPLVQLSSRREIMGAFVNARVTTLLGALSAAVIVALNVVLLVLTLLG